MVTVVNLKTLFPLSLIDVQIDPHLTRAIWDYKTKVFVDTLQELEVVGSKTLYYLAPLLWIDMQARADEYSESLDTFKDVDKFQNYWLERANSALNQDDNNITDSEVSYSCI